MAEGSSTFRLSLTTSCIVFSCHETQRMMSFNFEHTQIYIRVALQSGVCVYCKYVFVPNIFVTTGPVAIYSM